MNYIRLSRYCWYRPTTITILLILTNDYHDTVDIDQWLSRYCWYWPMIDTGGSFSPFLSSRPRTGSAAVFYCGVLKGPVGWYDERTHTNLFNRVEEVDEIILVGSRKRKRRDSVSPLSRLIRSCPRSSNHWSPIGWIYNCSNGRLVWQGRDARLCAI